MFKTHQNKNKYFMRYITVITLLISIVFLKTSCKKNDILTNNESHVTTSKVNTSQFFNLPTGTNSAAARVAKELEKQNQKTGFISTLATQAGFPVWDKATVRLLKDNSQNSNSLFEDYEGADTCILVPMVLQDAKHVNAFISATIINDSVTMRMYYKNDYKAFPFKASQPSPSITSAEDFALQMMLFDKEVFGHTEFSVKDKRLFLDPTVVKDTNNTKISIKLTPPNTNNLILCTTFEYTASQCEGCTGTCDNCGFPTCWSITITTETCREVGTTSGGGWPSAPTGPGGTGGGGGPTGGGGGNCVVGGLIIEGFMPPNPCNPPTGGNPLPPIPANITWLKNTLNLNPNQVDFLIQNPLRANEVYNYLELETNPQRIQIAKDHIEKMRTSPDYKDFVEEFNTDLQTAFYSYETEVENNLIDPCLKNSINDLTSRKHKNLVFKLYKKNNDLPKFPIKFKYTEVNSLPNDAPANTLAYYSFLPNNPQVATGALFEIQLNKNALVGKSKEYISSVILHELCHSLLKTVRVASHPNPFPMPTQDEEHTQIIEKSHFEIIFSALRELYPASSESEMKDLAIGGVAGILFDANGVLLNNSSTTKITNTFTGINITNAYTNTIPAYKNLTKGTICN
jgi:hypothetical protein